MRGAPSEKVQWIGRIRKDSNRTIFSNQKITWCLLKAQRFYLFYSMLPFLGTPDLTSGCRGSYPGCHLARSHQQQLHGTRHSTCTWLADLVLNKNCSFPAYTAGKKKKKTSFTLTTTQLQPTTLRGFPSRSILQRPTHSPSFLLSSTWRVKWHILSCLLE